MTIESWKEEFYSELNDDVVVKMTMKDALEHSIKKWKGLTKENLEKHNVHKPASEYNIISDDENVFKVNNESCALCWKYQYSDNDVYLEEDEDAEEDYDCLECPLFKVLENSRCDYSDNSPYDLWISTGNPENMIFFLEKALNNLE